MGTKCLRKSSWDEKMKIWPLKINISIFWKFHFLIFGYFLNNLWFIPYISAISYVTIQIFRPGLLLWFLYDFKKKFFQNFQKIELWGPVKGSRVIFEQKYFGIPPIITQALSKKKKSWNFHHRFFSYWQLILTNRIFNLGILVALKKAGGLFF